MVQIVAQRPHEQRQRLHRLEGRFGSLENGVHAVGHVKAVRPVVVRHTPVILLDGQHEANERVALEARQSEQVNEHEDGAVDFLHIIQTEGIEPELIDPHRCVSTVGYILKSIKSKQIISYYQLSF